MRKIRTRILSLLLCAAMLIGMVPGTAYAAEEETAETVAETTTTEPAVTETVETVPTETEPAETEPAETAETEPATEPVETEPAETEPEETAETEPEETVATEETVEFAEETFGAASGTCGDDLTWELDDNGVLTISGTGDMWDYHAADAAPWYENRGSLTSIVISGDVTGIGDFAFLDCSSLRSVTIPESVTSIGVCAFDGCSSLSSVTIPESVTSIGATAFAECTGLTSVSIPAGISVIELNTFLGCSGLTSVSIPEGVTDIGDSAFLGCSALTSVAIPEGVASIGASAFSWCSALTSVTIPASVTSIGDSAFSGDSGLKTVCYAGMPADWGKISIGSSNDCLINAERHYASTDPDNKSYICGDDLVAVLDGNGIMTVSGTGAMWDYSYGNTPWYENRDAITGIVVSDGVTRIGAMAFYSSSFLLNLESVIIPVSVTEIGDGAFDYCNIHAVYYGGTPTDWKNINIGSGNQNLENAPPSYLSTGPEDPKRACGDNLTWALDGSGVLTISGTGPMWDFDWYDDAPWFTKRDAVTEIVLSDGVTAVGKYAFCYCDNLTRVTVPKSVEKLTWFESCDNLSVVYYEGTYSQWQKLNNYGSYLKAKRIFCNCLSAEDLKGTCGDDLTWTMTEEGVLTVSGTGPMWNYDGSKAAARWLENYRSITSVVISEGVTSIGNSAFSDCTALTAVTIPDSVSVIGTGAFSGCLELTGIRIPDGVTGIRERAFSGCSKLAQVNFSKTLTSIDDYAFSGCGLTSLVIPENVTFIGNSAFQSNALTKVEILGQLKSIEDNTFNGCSKLTSIRLPDSVTSIGNGAFNGCTGLTDIAIPEGVTAIGSNAFHGCTGLTGIAIPESVTRIQSGAFSGCTGLTDVTLPKGLTAIGGEAFRNCTSLTGMVIPEGVTEIYNGTFRDCTSLASVTLPDHLLSIQGYAFYRCTSLTEITIPVSVQLIGDSAFKECSALRSVTLPRSITDIYRAAFQYCSALTDVYYGGTDWDQSKITVRDVNSELLNATWHYSDILRGYCGENVTYELNLITGLMTVSGTGPMYDYCYQESDWNPTPWDGYEEPITDIVISEGVTTIGNIAFPQCYNLRKLTIPEGVTYIGNAAFVGCSALTQVTLPESLEEMGVEVFLDCTSLKSISIPEGVTDIYHHAFANCASLTSVTLPASVTYVDFAAFSGCAALSDVYYGGTEYDRGQIIIDGENGELVYANWHCAAAATVPVYRLYNPYSQEHLFVSSKTEYDNLGAAGWVQEGVAWNSPADGDPVYRLYNPYTNGHFYTLSVSEKDQCVANGWKEDGVLSHSASPEDGLPIFRLFNPYEKMNPHHYTISVSERDNLVSVGWKYEGPAWFAAK